LKCIFKCGVVLLLGLLASSPVLACVVPGAPVTAEESACCRHMASQCGEGSMSSSHSCCKSAPAAEQVAVANVSFKLSPHLDLIYLAQFEFKSTRAVPEAFFAIAVSAHSPPESPPVSSEILRI
jgi:hypothetical protein